MINKVFLQKQYLFLAIFFLYVFSVFIPFIYFTLNQDLNFKFLISLSIFLFISLFLILNFEVKIKQFIFPILIMNIPGAIDNFFPSFSADPYPSIDTTISVISYFDIFIIFYFIIRILMNKKIINVEFDYIKTIFLILTILYSSIYVSNHLFDIYYVNGYGGILLFFRMFFILIIIDEIYTSKKIYWSYFYYGLITSFLLLIIDALINTYIIAKVPYLTHSTFANNVFSNIAVFIYAISWIYFQKRSYVILILTFSVLLLSGGKGAIIGLFFLIFFIYYSNIKKFKRLIQLVSITILAFSLYRIVEFINSSDYISAFSSMYTRSILWDISIQMIKDHLLFGTGYWTWNSCKYAYDFLLLGTYKTHVLWQDPYLLDAHNGYLHVLSEFGIMIFILIYSIFYYVYKKIHFYYFIPFFIWLLTEITNAGINKHQIFIFVIFFLYLTLKTRGNANT